MGLKVTCVFLHPLPPGTPHNFLIMFDFLNGLSKRMYALVSDPGYGSPLSLISILTIAAGFYELVNKKEEY